MLDVEHLGPQSSTDMSVALWPRMLTTNRRFECENAWIIDEWQTAKACERDGWPNGREIARPPAWPQLHMHIHANATWCWCCCSCCCCCCCCIWCGRCVRCNIWRLLLLHTPPFLGAATKQWSVVWVTLEFATILIDIHTVQTALWELPPAGGICNVTSAQYWWMNGRAQRLNGGTAGCWGN